MRTLLLAIVVAATSVQFCQGADNEAEAWLKKSGAKVTRSVDLPGQPITSVSLYTYDRTSNQYKVTDDDLKNLAQDIRKDVLDKR